MTFAVHIRNTRAGTAGFAVAAILSATVSAGIRAETFAPPPDAIQDDSANWRRSGGHMTALSSAGWTFADTSEGEVANLGSTFVVTWGRDSALVSSINEALALPEGSAPVDYAVRARVRRAAAATRAVGVNLQALWHGPRAPREPLMRRFVALLGNPAWESGEAFELCDAAPRARFRVWPTGGTCSIDGVSLRFDIRVDGGSTPERMVVEGLAIEKLGTGKGGGEDGASAVLCVEGMPPPAMQSEWEGRGLRVRVGTEPRDNERVAVVYAPSPVMPEADVRRIAAHVASGAALLLCTGRDGFLDTHAATDLDSLLPANTWSATHRLKRGPCTAVPARGAMAPFSAMPFSQHFDLHLSGSPIESPMVRYEPEKWLRPGAARILLETREDGVLPLLISRPAGPKGGGVFLFAADPEDATAMAAPGYEAFARWFARLPLDGEAAGRKAEFRPAAPAAWARAAAVEPFSIAIEEDEGTLGELAASPPPRDGIDGITSTRYVYRTGTAPRLRLRLRNHLANIAPLAEALDALNPGNFTAAGLNDSAFTHASTRGKLPIHAIWCGWNGSDRQRIELRWKRHVTVRGFRLWGFGPHRHWENSNPRDFTIASGGATLLSATNAVFTSFPFALERAVWEWPHSSIPTLHNPLFTLDSPLVLSVSALDPSANREPRCGRPANCALAEWEVWGWAGEPDDKTARSLSLRVIEEDLSTGTASTNSLLAATSIAFCAEHVLEVELSAHNAFGPVSWRFQMLEGESVVAERAFDAVFIPAEGGKLARKLSPHTADAGLLCTPAWRSADSFGIGMNKWSAGWGGPNDQGWALSQNLMEIGPSGRADPARMLATETRASHYTNPWGFFLDGESSWDWTMERLIDMVADPKGRWARIQPDSLHIVGSDRWNGVNAWTCFRWDFFDHFDRWLRAHGKAGLKGRTRSAVIEEIKTLHGDEWQLFLMRGYADRLLETQRRAAERGLRFTFETHGSFPLAGGELGADLARTHRGVGTDLFWDLHRQDLWGTLGDRLALLAVNPDLESGAYDEWGWFNSEQNPFWFGSNGEPEPSRRQWYATYWLGRVTLSGGFRPVHEMGFGAQGFHGVRYTARDHAVRTRVSQLMTQLRPESAAGIGLVVSWRGQERRMGPRLGRMGFGLYPEDGEADVESMASAVYSALVKQGAPIAFVTSTHALKNWRGSNPLVLVDAPNWEDWEWDAAQAAHRNGAPLLAIGAPHKRLANPRIVAALEAAGSGVASPLWSPTPAERLVSPEAAELWHRFSKVCRYPVEVPRGIVPTPFVSQGCLFLAICRQGDEDGPVTITVNPSALAPSVPNLPRQPRGVAVLDDGVKLPAAVLPDGRVRFTFGLAPCDGKIVMLCK